MSQTSTSTFRPVRSSLLAAAACVLLAVACSAAPVMQPNVADETAAVDRPKPNAEEAPVELGPEAFDACTGREQGSSCWVFVGDSSVNGDCAPVDTGRLACQSSR